MNDMKKLTKEQLEKDARELGYALVERPTKEQKLANVQKEIDRIETIKEPSDKELLAWAKENHDYYHEREMLNFYYQDKDNYKKLIKDANLSR